ncbi:site-specific DNA-methyltransferase [Pseudomonas syringae pv. syringae]|uniref:DNA-methyltransferase n=1 Tax=Pseudomonas syringae TaxID=317 RepID=UPI00200B5231|nr:site-specific DNA-methyltransferase [Pseudomonas syringae]MCK9701880.1 site-specific DNA-methyltransferase [Pseudomonas syringae pv. syringae]MCK9757376.1 site-specific DNA-methyltransferase [Pseudomonas syringae pv. syringae]
MSEVFLDDARNLKKRIKKQSIDVTITSPPYFDMKDYGHEGQIGFGQSYDAYLKDLKNVFKDVFHITKNSGSLWVVIDSFKRDGAVVTLPFDFAREISSVGWKLQDVIIWKKDKTVPWSKKGTTRKIFEYVLFFSKGNEFKYYSERARETRDLKEWWVRYPERYSPHGKSLEEIWEFSIPTQGSWGEGYIKHFCPLPEDLVKRILTLTTDEGDTVFDPFSGSGTVPAQAAFMARNFYGFELNEQYVQMFKNYLDLNIEKRLAAHTNSQISIDAEKFRTTILDLRILKYARVLFKKLKSDGVEIKKIWVERSNVPLEGKYEITSAKYVLLVAPGMTEQLKTLVTNITRSPPLSKFGILADILAMDDVTVFSELLPSDRIFLYTQNNTHQHKNNATANRSDDGVILSSIELNINEELYRNAR